MAYPEDIAVVVKVTYADGSPVGGAVVTLQNGNYTDFYIASTDDRGFCDLTGVRPGSSALRALVSADGRGTTLNGTSVWYEAQNVTYIVVTLPDSSDVSGAVRLKGLPAGASIVVLDGTTIYDTGTFDGRFSFKAPIGDHSIYAALYTNGTIYVSEKRAISVKPSLKETYVLELKPVSNVARPLPEPIYDRLIRSHDNSGSAGPIILSGNLYGADGTPVANATLTAESYYREPAGTTVTGENGLFAFDGVSVATDIVRFKADILDNGIHHISYSKFYPAQDASGLSVQLTDYPAPTQGYIYGIIALSGEWSNATPLNGTVYLSNGLSQEVTRDHNSGQFFFAVPPGIYEVYAEHYDGSDRYVSEKQRLFVDASWTATSVNPTLLVVRRNQIYPGPLLLAIIIGFLCLGAGYALVKKWI